MAATKKYTYAVAFLIVFAAIYWSIQGLMPHQITNLNMPKNEFSTERALIQLKKIAEKPHFTGTEAHKEVREYLIKELEKMGLKVEVQEQVAVNKKWRGATNTKNILARIKGTGNGKALLLLTHYDSAPHSSYGASDAGSGVVTILEGVRAFIASGRQPLNDVIILITDAEELGLLGANAFVNNHPWAKDVGLVVNFEARGSGGPSYMLLETNGGNKKLIEAFNKAHPRHPVGNSLLYSIYKMLPNDTDLTVFREDGNIDGFNFAFIDDHFDYHTAQDTYDRLDRNTLEQQGEYLMALLNYFSDADLGELTATEDDVFFNFPGTEMIHWPFSWVLPLLLLAVFWWLALLFSGFKKKILSAKEIFKGLFAFLIVLILSGGLAFYGWKWLLKIYPQYNDILHGFTYNGHFYITAFIALSLGISFKIYTRYLKKNRLENLMIGPVFIWLLINAAVALYLPGAGFFIIPVFVSLLILSVLIYKKNAPVNQPILFALFTAPVLLIFSPLIVMFPVGLGLKNLVISAVFTVLIFTVVLPVFASFKDLKRISSLFFLIALLTFVSAGFSASYTVDRKKPNSVIYYLDSDQQKAFWASYDRETDAFTRQFLGEHPHEGSFTPLTTASKYGKNYKLYQDAPLLKIPAPEITIEKDTIENNSRFVAFTITTKRNSNRIELISKNPLHFQSFRVNGESLRADKTSGYVFDTVDRRHVLSYYLTEGDHEVKIAFSVPVEEKPQLEIIEVSYDLYTNDSVKKILPALQPRSEIMMPTPFVINDAILIKKNLSFE